MTDALSLANEALILIGADEIESFSDGSTQQKVVDRLYTRNKQSLLRSYEWNCALRRATITADAPNSPNAEYSHQHSLPKGCLRVIKVFVGGMDPEPAYEGRRAYAIEGSKIFIDAEEIEISYIKDIPESELDAHVHEALVYKLAAEMVYSLKESNTTTQRLKGEAMERLNEARTTDSLENPATVIRIDGLSRVRY